MQFVVRYWSSQLPKEYRQPDGEPILLDYSSHPPTKIGLHNALLTQQDRIEVLASHSHDYRCEVFVVENHQAYVLTQHVASELFKQLPNGEVKWITLCEFLLPQNRRKTGSNPTKAQLNERQLHLFEAAYEKSPSDSASKLDIDI